ncbi:MAG: hypothetical protein QOG42_1894, partial [Solirubrobacteraceae bacterium]|nr:hypothetical protein [Solirubrobacteraceae bacterium]
MPAETAPTDERFARALAWERRAHEQAAAWIEALGYGQAYLNERVPHVHWANMLWVTARDGVDGAELVADADRILSDFAHRQLVVEHEALWRTLEAEMAAAGWEREALVYMSHERPPDRMPDLAAVREVGHDDIAAAEDRCMQGEHETATAEARRQVLA